MPTAVISDASKKRKRAAEETATRDKQKRTRDNEGPTPDDKRPAPTMQYYEV
jgi:hypothetical protein